MALERLDKLAAEAAGMTRSEVKKLIAKGLVQADGVVLRAPDAKVEQGASITVNGREFSHQKFVYLMLDKPEGIVSASKDARDKTVADLVRHAYPRRELFPAGRLDKTSTGFVLLTDDGAFAHDILSPKRHVPKTYEVTLDTPATAQMANAFEAGVTLADGERMKPAGLLIDSENPCHVTVELRQGVYHQIKRMFGVYDAGVNALRRTAIGDVPLDQTLGAGGFRELTAQELAVLFHAGRGGR